jgi:hypothetical protein
MSMPFFERNSFVRRQLLHPGWVKYMNLSVAISMVVSWDGTAGFRISAALGILPESSKSHTHVRFLAEQPAGAANHAP